MAEVTVTVNGRDYRVACEDGQEDRLKRLAGQVGQKVAELIKSIGRADDGRLLVMASLLLADELADARDALEDTRARLQAGGSAPGGELTPWLGTVATRLEALADALEKS